jgi:hypothetical protein
MEDCRVVPPRNDDWFKAEPGAKLEFELGCIEVFEWAPPILEIIRDTH